MTALNLRPHKRRPWGGIAWLLLATGLGGCAVLGGRETTVVAPAAVDWAAVTAPVESAVAHDPAIESRIDRILAGMTLAQKVGQMTQAEIHSITPDEVRRFHIGSVLNGGGGWPGKDKRANAAKWLAMAEQWHAASVGEGGPDAVPILWGTDAVHGHNNAFGATVFPHNIGLGAAGDADLVQRVAQATARAVRATGIGWVFGPTIAVAQDTRWGRTYESFSEDPALVARLGAAHVRGLQGRLGSDDSVLATAKHFIGDGGTALGRDQGVTRATPAELVGLHGAGYRAALQAGAQTVMASFNSWVDAASGIDHGKIHGSRALLTGLLKERLGFDGLVVSDWNGIGQVTGCKATSCAAAINAGIDMVMAPDGWREFIANTMTQVGRGQIPMARIDDAVRRILRVKLRAGLFGKRPGDSRFAGQDAALQARELGREAVRRSLVLLKNQDQVLPLRRDRRVLVVGKGADSMEIQTGGWTLSWQGSGNARSDFPAADTVLDGIVQALGAARVVYRTDASGVDLNAFDAVIAVIGERPYAEGNGDIPAFGTLHHAGRYPEDLALLKAVAGRGKPVVTVLLSGRPVYANDLINLSDAFVAAWLPGTEGGGIADLLFASGAAQPPRDFSGRLSFRWPASPCPTASEEPLFARGDGMGLRETRPLGRLPERAVVGGCGAPTEISIFKVSAQRPYELLVASSTKRWKTRLAETESGSAGVDGAPQPDIRWSTVQINTQADARLVTWMAPVEAPASLLAWAAPTTVLGPYANAALVFDVAVSKAPTSPVRLGMACEEGGCAAALDIAEHLRALPLNVRHTIKVPLRCFAAAGADLQRIAVPFRVDASAPFAAAFARVHIAAGAALQTDALRCDALRP